jgi:hypothetical protein
MNKIVQIASAAAILLGISVLGQGCVLTDCHKETDPDTGETKEVCSVESLVKYNGSKVNETLTYAPGMNISVDSQNGKVTMIAGSSDTVGIVFSPFTFRPDGEKEEASTEIKGDLNLTHTADGEIIIGVSKDSGSSSGLGADIVITLPAGFDSQVSVHVNNGSLEGSFASGVATATTLLVDNGSMTVNGLSGTLNVQADGTNCSVGISSWGTTNGTIDCDWLDSQITVASGISGSLQLQSQNKEITAGTLPTDWVASEENASNSQSYSFGADPGSFGTLLMVNSGSIELSVN